MQPVTRVIWSYVISCVCSGVWSVNSVSRADICPERHATDEIRAEFNVNIDRHKVST